MLDLKSVSRALLAGLMAVTLTGVTPAAAAPAVPAPLHDVMSMALLPAPVQQPGTPATPSASPAAAADQSKTATGASPAAQHHLPKWAWATIIVGAAVAVGVGVLVANGQSGHTAAAIPGATVQAGGSPTAGAP